MWFALLAIFRENNFESLHQSMWELGQQQIQKYGIQARNKFTINIDTALIDSALRTIKV